MEKENTGVSKRLHKKSGQAAVITACILLFFILAHVAGRKGVSSFDLWVTQALQSVRSPFMTGLMVFISWFGYAPQAVIPVFIGAAFFYLKKHRLEAGWIVLASLVVQLLTVFVKLAYHRPRPSSDLVFVFEKLNSYSFPSGHVLFYTVFFGLMWYFTAKVLPVTPVRTVIRSLSGGLVVSVGISRVYLGEHWASDVAAGYILGGMAFALLVFFYKRMKKKSFP